MIPAQKYGLMDIGSGRSTGDYSAVSGGDYVMCVWKLGHKQARYVLYHLSCLPVSRARF